MSNYMTAKEAKELQEKKLPRKTDAVLKDIKKYIESGLGADYIYYYKPLNEPTVKELKALGYKVEFQQDFREGDFYKIKW